MFIIQEMSIKEFLNKKYFEMIGQEGRRITVEEFGKLFGAGKSLTAMWLNGERIPANEYKKRIIERYGDVFTLQRLMGHKTLEMTMRYVNFVKSDLQEIHRYASPVDNWKL